MKKDIKEIKKLEMCISSTCNLRCKHCYQHFEKNKYKLTMEQITNIIDYVCIKGCNFIVLSGGEFFTHENAYDIIDYVLKKNVNLLLVTNGTLIDKNKIIKYSNEKLSFQISIDGTKELHDDRRGTGNYDKTIETIKFLRSNNYFVRANMTLDNDNYNSVSKILNDDNFDNITFLPVANAGAANINKHVSSCGLNECIETIYKEVTPYRDINARCTCFPLGLSVNYDGTVYPCSIARDFKLFSMGNLNENKIETIIETFLNDPISDQFYEYESNAQIKKCTNCVNKEKCNQGCRMRAYKFFGDMLNPDPFCCKIYRKDFEDIDYADIYWGNHE